MNFFNINGYDLDETQIAAIKSEAKSTLVVAGAGSGKTLTILGKIKYLIEKKNVNEKQILCISFTNETVNALKDKTVMMGYNLDIYTFHKLGLSILGNVNIISDNYLDYIIDEYFESVIKYDKSKFIKSLFFTDKNINKVYMTNGLLREYRNLTIFGYLIYCLLSFGFIIASRTAVYYLIFICALMPGIIFHSRKKANQKLCLLYSGIICTILFAKDINGYISQGNYRNCNFLTYPYLSVFDDNETINYYRQHLGFSDKSVQ